MKKGTIIIGPERSGKSRLAREMAGAYPPGSVTTICARSGGWNKRSPFKRIDVHENTKLIIADDVNKRGDIDRFYNLITGGQICERPYKDAIILSCDVIITCDEQVTADMLTDESLLRRFEIIDLTNDKS